MNYKKKFFTS